jgi:AcrR family transcriptional regulator
MKARRRLTRQESKDLTRMRLIEAAETLFIRKGFDDTSVEDISEMAGYSRGAFYSNFNDKEQVLLAVIDRRRPQVLDALDDGLQRILEPAERIAAVREWYSNEWRRKDLIALQLEFSRRAMKDRSIRKHLAERWQQEVGVLAGSVCRYAAATNGAPVDRPEIIGLVLLAVAHGLGTLALDTGPEWEHMYAEAARLAFDRITAPPISNLG